MHTQAHSRRRLLASAFAPTLTLPVLLLQAAEPAGAPARLPLTELILYSSGVGYFERAGQVAGRAEVELRFKTDDINDLLKSMVVQDFNGGRVGSVTYGSRDPITKTLRSFGLDLTKNPTQAELLAQVRGEKVEVRWPNPVTGTIVGVERRKQPAGEKGEVDVDYLNLLTDDGLQSIPLPQVQKLRLLSERLNTELRQALEVLASGHDTQKKTVTITFDGQGQRKVAVAYIAQTPVWKTSYRLVLDEKAQPFLQGWAIVENTSDEDWNNVTLSLVSGRPISFSMDLYQPLYTTRPVVVPELYSSLRPQVYGDAVDRPSEAAPRPAAAGRKMERALALADAAGLAAAPMAKGMASEQAAMAFNFNLADSDRGGIGGGVGRLGLESAVTASADAGQAGELFQYQIKTPVTLARQKSAMLPIIHQTAGGEKVSIYNAAVQPKHPLNGFRLKNTTPLHLMQGPITVFDAGTYAGDARIEDLAPGQERLLSYGLDLNVEVETQSAGGVADIATVRIRKGTLIAVRKGAQEHTYNVRNRDQKPRTVLVEHPFRSDWNLVAPKEKPERTRDVYRFPVTVAADRSQRLVVTEEKQFEERVALVGTPHEIVAQYIRAPKVSEKVKSALQRAAEMRNAIGVTAAERGRREQRTAEITQEQGRIRENMQRINSNSELYGRYMKKLDQQETDLEALRQEIEDFKAREAKQEQELNDYLMNLEVE